MKLSNFLKRFKKNYIKFDFFIKSIDFFIMLMMIFVFVSHLLFLVSTITNYLNEYSNINVFDYISYAVEPGSSTSAATSTTPINNTTTTVIRGNDIWSDIIRSLFIYGTGAYRLSLLKGGGTLSSRAFVLGTTFLLDGLSRFVNNIINDTGYLKSCVERLQPLWRVFTKGEVAVKVDDKTLKNLSDASTNSNNFLGDSNNLDDFLNTFLNAFFEKFGYLFSPVKVNYSNELLANQIQDISVLLFIMTLLVTFLIAVLIFNIFLYINMDRIIKFFNNKVIRWYLLYNKKIMSIEIFLLGIIILTFMHTISKGLLFIATHPITIT